MKIFASTYPDSKIEDAFFTLGGMRPSGPDRIVQIPIERYSANDVDIPKHWDFDPTTMILNVRSHETSVAVYARHIPLDSEIHLIGVNKDFFLGMIVHQPMKNTAPRCELRCVPTDKPVTGPGCIPCRKGSLIFKVCC